MREIEYKGIRVFITEKDWQSLLRRFDATNSKRVGSRFIIQLSCRLCVKHRFLFEGCGHCPLDAFRISTEPGCLRLIHEIIDLPDFIVSTGQIEWFVLKDKEARNQLNKIRDIIQDLPEKEP